MKIKLVIFIVLAAFVKTSFAQLDPFVAEIRIFAGNFAPKGWAKCEGQLLPISQNTALFSLLGTTYGGDGKSTFALPDLRERVIIAPGQGAGLSLYTQGQTGGEAPLVLLPANLPAHTHDADVKISSATGTSSTPSTSMSYASSPKQVFNGTSRDIWPYTTAAGTLATTSASFSTSVTGNSVPVNNRQPYLVCNYIIALQGIFPPRP
jgi:microcystin-dependent protein